LSVSVVIVTGGTFGIGQAITVLLAQRGHQVIALGLAAPQVSSTAEGTASIEQELASHGVNAEVLEADVSSAADVQRAVDHALKHYGRIDGLVNNAAIGPLGTILDTDEATWDRIIDVNLKGAYLCSRAVIPHMVKQGGGAIVNVGSGAGWGKPNMAAYSSSKGGMVALTMAMAYDHFHDHVRVNMVVPGGGGIVTGMSVGRFGGDVERFTSRAAPGTVAGRVATPMDIAKPVAFLLSEDAAVISGTVLDVGCFAHQGGPVPGKH
jgi:NAD(P)-dependent dehydrogenase (short-subunit alcohol dehydrogenase family)